MLNINSFFKKRKVQNFEPPSWISAISILTIWYYWIKKHSGFDFLGVKTGRWPSERALWIKLLNGIPCIGTLWFWQWHRLLDCKVGKPCSTILPWKSSASMEATWVSFSRWGKSLVFLPCWRSTFFLSYANIAFRLCQFCSWA